MNTTGSEIWRRRHDLEKQRRDETKRLMAEFNAGHYARMGELRKECEAATGHNFTFSHIGPVGHAWFYCSYCGASRVDEP